MTEVTITDCHMDKHHRVTLPGPARRDHGIDTGEYYDVSLDTNGNYPFRAKILDDGRFRIPPRVYEMETFDVAPGDHVDVTINV